MTYDFDMKLGIYYRWISLADGTKVKLVSRDTTSWHQSNLTIGTSQIAPTRAELFHDSYRMQSTKKRPPKHQAGNYHPPRLEKTLRKKNMEQDQKTALLNAYDNRNLTPEDMRKGYKLDEDGKIVWNRSMDSK